MTPDMDVDLARTFLTIADTAHFGKAAKALNVTQSTISARIKTLEDLLGQPLFDRSKTGTTLTQAGNRFKSSAEMMIRVWEQARQQVNTPSEFQAVVSVGAEKAYRRTVRSTMSGSAPKTRIQ